MSIPDNTSLTENFTSAEVATQVIESIPHSNTHHAAISADHLRGLIDLSEDAFEQAVNVVQRTHRAISGEPFSILEKIPVTAQPSEAVRLIHDGIADLTYGAIKGGGRLTALIARGIVSLRK